MNRLIVVTSLDQLTPVERWPRVIGPLTSRLAESGLGDLPDLVDLKGELDRNGVVGTTEIAIRLANFDYGREYGDIRSANQNSMSTD